MKKLTFKKILLYFVVILVSAFSLFPFYSMICMSTHTRAQVYKGEIFTIGTALMKNVNTILKSDFLRWYGNSLLVAVFSTAASVLVSCMCGYGLAKYRVKASKMMFNIVIATMMIPTQTSIIGYVIEMKYMNLLNSHLPLIFNSIAWPFGVFWVFQFSNQGVPTEVIEAARIDGCNEFQTFVQIGIPFLFPAISSLSMIAFLNSWNSFLLPLVLISKSSLLTLQVGIRSLGDMFSRDIAAQVTGLAMGIVPMLIIFVIGGKYFVRGLTDGAVKG